MQLNFINFNKSYYSLRDLLDVLRYVKTNLQKTPLREALQKYLLISNNDSVKLLIVELLDHIDRGNNFSDWLAEQHVLPRYMLSCIIAAEKRSNLPSGLEQAFSYYNHLKKIKTQIALTLIYPAIILLVCSLLGGFFLLWFVPQLVSSFSDLGIMVPATLSLLNQIGLFISHYFLLLLLVVCLAIFAGIITLKKNPGCILKLLSITPLVKQAVYFWDRTQFYRNLRQALDHNSILTVALPDIGQTMVTAKAQTAISRIIVLLHDGEKFSKAVSETMLYDPTAHLHLQSGEDAGNLINALVDIDSYFTEKINNYYEIFKNLLEPALIILMSFFIFMLALVLLAPINSIMNNINF